MLAELILGHRNRCAVTGASAGRVALCRVGGCDVLLLPSAGFILEPDQTAFRCWLGGESLGSSGAQYCGGRAGPQRGAAANVVAMPWFPAPGRVHLVDSPARGRAGLQGRLAKESSRGAGFID